MSYCALLKLVIIKFLNDSSACGISLLFCIGIKITKNTKLFEVSCLTLSFIYLSGDGDSSINYFKLTLNNCLAHP